MAKKRGTADQDANQAAPDSVLNEVIALSGIRMFEDAEPTMLLDPSGLVPDGMPETDLDLRVSLSLEELLPDDAGEVVLVTPEDIPVDLLASESITAAGIAPEHITLSGVEVTGLHYYSFESGLTVYSPVDLLILDDTGIV